MVKPFDLFGDLNGKPRDAVSPLNAGYGAEQVFGPTPWQPTIGECGRRRQDIPVQVTGEASSEGGIALNRVDAAATLAAFGLIVSAPVVNAETIDQLLANTPEASERPSVSGLHDQGYGYLDYRMVSQAWDRTCWFFGGAHGASSIAVADAKDDLLGMRFTPREANAIIGIALRVHEQPGIESCP